RFPRSKKKALAGLGYVTLTAGGDFHPALRTSAARNGRPDTNMTKASGVSKRFQPRKSACPHADGTGRRRISRPMRPPDRPEWPDVSRLGVLAPPTSGSQSSAQKNAECANK